MFLASHAPLRFVSLNPLSDEKICSFFMLLLNIVENRLHFSKYSKIDRRIHLKTKNNNVMEP